MSTDKKETKVKVLSEAEKVKAEIDTRGLTPAQVADLMVLMAKDLKKNVKSTSKKEPKDPNAPKKEVNSGLKGWLDFTAQVRDKVKELGEDKLEQITDIKSASKLPKGNPQTNYKQLEINSTSEYREKSKV